MMKYEASRRLSAIHATLSCRRQFEEGVITITHLNGDIEPVSPSMSAEIKRIEKQYGVTIYHVMEVEPDKYALLAVSSFKVDWVYEHYLGTDGTYSSFCMMLDKAAQTVYADTVCINVGSSASAPKLQPFKVRAYTSAADRFASRATAIFSRR